MTPVTVKNGDKVRFLHFGADLTKRVRVETVPGFQQRKPYEEVLYPHSYPGFGERFRGIGALCEYGSTHSPSKHIAPNGLHRIFEFLHLKFIEDKRFIEAYGDFRQIITDSARALTTLGLASFLKPERQQQLELFPVSAKYSGFVLMAEVKHKEDSKPFVVLDSSVLLALDAATYLVRDNEQVYDLSKLRKVAKGVVVMPAPKPEIFFIDKKTQETYSLSDADREAFWGDRKVFQIIPNLKIGSELELIKPTRATFGKLFLVTAKLEALPEHLDGESKTDICLADIVLTKELIRRHPNNSLVGVLVMVNLSGQTSFQETPILSTLWRPQGAYKEVDCPLCHPQQI